MASSNREVLLIEADPAGGSLSQKLGVQYTPGTASFVASERPISAENLVEHAQDVLLSDLHVMPAPSSPAGAKSIADTFAKLGDRLRDVSESEMAVIVDAGRLTADVRMSQLTMCASAILVVSRNNSQLSSLEHLEHLLVDDPTEPGPLGLSLCVGESPLSPKEWDEHFGLDFVGSIDLELSATTDLSMFMPRGKRKSRKLLNSLGKIADRLYEFAYPAEASEPRPRLHMPDPVDDDEADPVGGGAGLPAVSGELSPDVPATVEAAQLVDPQYGLGAAPPTVPHTAVQQAVEVHVHNQPAAAAQPLPPPPPPPHYAYPAPAPPPQYPYPAGGYPPQPPPPPPQAPPASARSGAAAPARRLRRSGSPPGDAAAAAGPPGAARRLPAAGPPRRPRRRPQRPGRQRGDGPRRPPARVAAQPRDAVGAVGVVQDVGGAAVRHRRCRPARGRCRVLVSTGTA